jgi:hypothetical protein
VAGKTPTILLPAVQVIFSYRRQIIDNYPRLSPRKAKLKICSPLTEHSLQLYRSLLAYQKGIRGGSLTLKGTRLKPAEIGLAHYRNDLDAYEWDHVTEYMYRAAFWWLLDHDPDDREADEGDFQTVDRT